MLQRYHGAIAGASFTSGETVVVGLWRASPLGPFVQVMWVRHRRLRGAAERILLTPREHVRQAVVALYDFDESRVVGVRGGFAGGVVAVEAGPLRLRLQVAPRDWRSWLLALRPEVLLRRPWWVTLEDRLARPLVGRLLGGGAGVRAAGTAPGGQREWYGALDWRAIAAGSLQVDGLDAGALTDLPADLGVGMSSFLTRPALVNVVTTVEERDG